MDTEYTLENDPLTVEDGTSQTTDSDGLYWADSTSQEELWAEVIAGDEDALRDKNDEPENHAGPALVPDAETEASVHVRVAKRPKVVPEPDVAVEQTPLAGTSTSQIKGKGKTILAGPGSDDDALWAEFPSSQIGELVPTQPSFNFSETGSHNSSMTSMSSSASSGKRKRTEPEPLPSLIDEIAKAMCDPPERRRGMSVKSTSGPLPAMKLEEPIAGPSKLVESGAFHIIAHDRRAQELMDTCDISWGTQYEIARGVCNDRWTWNDITLEKLQQLKGTNQDAARRVSSILMGTTSPVRDYTPRGVWEELDREQEAIIENENRGLGLRGEWQGKANWFGGKIQQIAKMEFVPATGSFVIRLEHMQMTRSHRFARFLGSRRILQMKYSGDRRNIALERRFLMQKFVLCGRVFVPFSTKDSKVYLVETTEDYERKATDAQGDGHRLALEEFVQWHNPLAMNQKQPIAKWATRFDLGLSTSIPVLRFAPKNIFMLKDICAKHDGPKVPTEKIFTDGCGWINRAALVAIAENLGASEVPTAVQGRVFGAKGVWILHPHNHAEDEDPKIWIRSSQQKIKLTLSELECSDSEDIHPAHLIFDLVAPSIVTVKTRLSRLTVVNLAHNGVPRGVFVKLMRENLLRELKPLTQWDSPYAMQLLLYYLDKGTGASSSRLQQFISGAQRVLGQSRKREIGDGPDDELGTLLSKTLASGQPLSLAEEVLHLVKAGFKPTEEFRLFDKLKTIITFILTEIIKKCHIPIPNSADAFIVPDPFGVLQEGEIHFTSSRVLQESLHCLQPRTIIGDVLLYRNPARLPSDIRKVRAVDCGALRRYTDVIVLPVTGSCSLASLLAGGDVDGDVAVCIWDQDIVEAFTNAPVNAMPGHIVEECFEPESTIESVSAVFDEVQASPRRAEDILHRRLLSGLTESKVGIYSNYHEIAIYALGYDHPETLRLAYMFNIMLDSRKTGHVVKAAISQRDQRDYDRDLPACMADSDPGRNPHYPRRADGLPKFIVELLIADGKKIKDECLAKYGEQSPPERSQGSDEQVLGPYTRCSKLSTLAEELRIVETFVKEFHQRYMKLWVTSPQKTLTSAIRRQQQQARQKEALHSLVAEYVRSIPKTGVDILLGMGVLENVAASYAYSLSTKFAYTVAFTQLTHIKAVANGIMPVTAEMAATMTVSAGFARAIEQKTMGIA